MKELDKGLRQLVSINFLKKIGDKYTYHQHYKDVLDELALTTKSRSKISIVVEALFRGGYFRTPRSGRETRIVCLLLLLDTKRGKHD